MSNCVAQKRTPVGRAAAGYEEVHLELSANPGGPCRERVKGPRRSPWMDSQGEAIATGEGGGVTAGSIRSAAAEGQVRWGKPTGHLRD